MLKITFRPPTSAFIPLSSHQHNMSARTAESTSNEQAPLLGEVDARRRHDNGLPPATPARKRRPKKPKTASGAAYIVAILLAHIVALELSNSFIEPSLGQLEEAAICRDYFGNDDVRDPATDPRCKSEPVQSELSMLQGVELTIALLPGLLTSVPYGIAAERYGRRVILIVCTFGLMLMYPLDLVVGMSCPSLFAYTYSIGPLQSIEVTDHFSPDSAILASQVHLAGCKYELRRRRGPRHDGAAVHHCQRRDDAGTQIYRLLLHCRCPRRHSPDWQSARLSGHEQGRSVAHRLPLQRLPRRHVLALVCRSRDGPFPRLAWQR